jgi:hypothetical protein
VSLSAGANDERGMPGGLGAICCDGWRPAYMDHGCCITNDDRTRLSSDPADPHSGRYSLKIHIPTRVPLWIPIPLLTKHAPGPLQNSTTYRYVYTHIIGYALMNVMTEWFFLLPADDILLLEILWPRIVVGVVVAA